MSKSKSILEQAGIEVSKRELSRKVYNLKPCPWCNKNDRLVVEEEFGCFYVQCERCIANGPEAYNVEDAKNGWDQRELYSSRIETLS